MSTLTLTLPFTLCSRLRATVATAASKIELLSPINSLNRRSASDVDRKKSVLMLASTWPVDASWPPAGCARSGLGCMARHFVTFSSSTDCPSLPSNTAQSILSQRGTELHIVKAQTCVCA